MPRLAVVPVNLALQGGGAHGAFTWGVLDALLEDGRIVPDGLSGTSAGAMNAVALAHGWALGGRDGARAALRAFWMRLAEAVPMELAHHDLDGGVHLAPGARLWLAWLRHFAPAQINPFDINPLRDILREQFDFERLRHASPLRVHVAATHADSGRLRVFGNAELSVDVLLASGCLPTVFRAPRIDGEAYWDGGYAANPAVFPLLHADAARDTLIVLLSPLAFAPLHEADTAKGIEARVAEIAFTANFQREMQALARERVTAASRWWPPRRWASPALRARFHLIEAGPALDHLAGETRLAVSRSFFERLHRLGREHAVAWLARHAEALGRRDSVDLPTAFG